MGDVRYVIPPRRTGSVDRVLVGSFLVGAAVAVVLGVYGRLHEPTGVAVNVAGFSGPLEAKVWLASAGLALAVVQLVSALALYGRLPVGTLVSDWGPVHRWSGRLAFLLTVPVAVHCLYAVGFQSFDARTLGHSLFGCLFYGAFTAKMLTLTRRETPGWLLPTLGGGVFALLVLLWATSALWFFLTVGVRF
jgi:hypothetical protein